LHASNLSAFFLAAMSALLGLPLLVYLKGFAFAILYLMFTNRTCIAFNKNFQRHDAFTNITGFYGFFVVFARTTDS
jgi:hypothetical protein